MAVTSKPQHVEPGQCSSRGTLDCPRSHGGPCYKQLPISQGQLYSQCMPTTLLQPADEMRSPQLPHAADATDAEFSCFVRPCSTQHMSTCQRICQSISTGCMSQLFLPHEHCMLNFFYMILSTLCSSLAADILHIISSAIISSADSNSQQ